MRRLVSLYLLSCRFLEPSSYVDHDVWLHNRLNPEHHFLTGIESVWFGLATRLAIRSTLWAAGSGWQLVRRKRSGTQSFTEIARSFTEEEKEKKFGK